MMLIHDKLYDSYKLYYCHVYTHSLSIFVVKMLICKENEYVDLITTMVQVSIEAFEAQLTLCLYRRPFENEPMLRWLERIFGNILLKNQYSGTSFKQ